MSTPCPHCGLRYWPASTHDSAWCLKTQMTKTPMSQRHPAPDASEAAAPTEHFASIIWEPMEQTGPNTWVRRGSSPGASRPGSPDTSDTPRHALHMPAGLHADTRYLVKRFAEALAHKLYDAEKKYGYDNGWSGSAWEGECRERLYEHVQKGDPLDVANYCAFMWHHGWSTKANVSATTPTAIEQDAARYRWLRDRSVPPHNFYIAVPDEFHDTRYTPQEVDAAIDAAISSSAPPTEGGNGN